MKIPTNKDFSLITGMAESLDRYLVTDPYIGIKYGPKSNSRDLFRSQSL